MDTASPLPALISSARQLYRSNGGAVLDVLLRNFTKGENELQDRLQIEAGVELATPDDLTPDWSHLDMQSARNWHCVIVRRKALPGLWLAMADPWDNTLLQRVSRRVGVALEPLAAMESHLADWLKPTEPMPEESSPYPDATQASMAVALAYAHDAEIASGPVVVFANNAIRAAYELGASDVHFECDRAGVTVKHRLDGVMARFSRMEGVQAAQQVISRIKVLSQLDITERRIPQDGRFRFDLPGHSEGSIDLRVSIMPSVFGEDAVLRLLDKAQLRRQDVPVSLNLLGFDSQSAQLIRDLSNEPSGMLLVTGPTGSGKTTTVYAVLSEINTGHEKIITIEDPVEYELPGVLQIPVNERKGLTFAKGLRSILRHDPDRILVGEIRDAETAEIAVQSALTGHLVFTTVHANGIADIMGRFRHFGLDMFGFMSSLNGVVVQRLMRRVCAHCVEKQSPTEREIQWFSKYAQAIPYGVPRPVGCNVCNGSGYKGRFVVSEVHVVDDSLRDHVTEGSPVSVLKRHAQERGVVSLAQQAARCVATFETTLEEVKRVVGWL
jgi:general secretion pathway protein E